MKTLCFLKLNIREFSHTWGIYIGGRSLKNRFITVRKTQEFKDGIGLTLCFGIMENISYRHPLDIHRPPSQTLLDLLANWQYYKFDMPIYDCLLEEYPELGDYL